MTETVGCVECGNVLTEEETHYYECRCELCEREAHERLQRWRAGEDNPELDSRFGDQRTFH